MCGLAGIASSENPDEIQASLLKMLDLIRHRGPDGQGMELYPLNAGTTLALGHQRLAIIDTTDAGLMPMYSHNRKLSIVYNGEIYNYLELKEELKGLGHNFNTDTDTEVLLNSYIQWGEECLNKLNGMFAFAIFEHETKDIFLARDRFGVKPLYYFHDDNHFLFASEIKSILSHPNYQIMVNETALGKFLYTGLLNDNEETFFSSIFSLEPGHSMRYQNGSLYYKRWYEGLSDYDSDISLENDDKTTTELFSNAVDIRLRSDVEVGACLSGGMDSSAIVGAISHILSSREEDTTGSFKTFSAVFDDPDISEKAYVDEVTKSTKTDNFQFKPSNDLFWERIYELIWHNDEPIQSTSQFMQWSVFEEAKKNGVTVTLDGQGADELAAGYPAYFSVYLAELFRNLKFKEFFITLKDIVTKDGEGSFPLRL